MQGREERTGCGVQFANFFSYDRFTDISNCNSVLLLLQLFTAVGKLHLAVADASDISGLNISGELFQHVYSHLGGGGGCRLTSLP